MDDNKLLPKLSQNLLEILNDEKYYDITIEVPYVKLIFGLKIKDIIIWKPVIILASSDQNSMNKGSLDSSRQDELNGECLISLGQNDGTLAHIKLLNMSPEIFQIILRYIYGGKLSLEEYDTLDIIKIILVSANDLSLQELTKYLIKFYDLTSKEFLEKTDPNSKTSDNTKLGITKESKRTVDSKIITYQHVELISKWIDRLEIIDKLISSYKFRLLFRASCDVGHSRDKFHEICNNQPRTVTLVKVNEILGGYNPLEWKSDQMEGSALLKIVLYFLLTMMKLKIIF
ncbi:unnamed protein product [Rhizophagus irregularis]|nr:unnamed protein product [Rhizophagus irregularis]